MHFSEQIRNPRRMRTRCRRFHCNDCAIGISHPQDGPVDPSGCRCSHCEHDDDELNEYSDYERRSRLAKNFNERGYNAQHMAIMNHKKRCLHEFNQTVTKLDRSNSKWFGNRSKLNYSMCIKKSHLNLGNKLGQTHLHLAIQHETHDEALELIERGADINAQDHMGGTPLQYAILSKNLEALCMLLHYGVDVGRISCKPNGTSLVTALCFRAEEIAKVSAPHRDESTFNIPGFTILHFYACCDNCLSSLHSGNKGVQYIAFYRKSAPNDSMPGCNTADWFESVWSTYDRRIIPMSDYPILHHLLTHSPSKSFTTSDWVKSMYRILQSPLAFNLLQHYSSNVNKIRPKTSCFKNLVNAFNTLKVERNDRVNIINICLSLGWKIDDCAINACYISFGFNDELESFLSCSSYFHEPPDVVSGESLYLQPNYAFSVEGEPTAGRVVTFLKYQLKSSRCHSKAKAASNRILDALGFFALPLGEKQDLLDCGIRVWSNECGASRNPSLDYEVLGYQAFAKKVNSIPESPSLLELSRNQTRTFFKQAYTINRAYQFLDILKNLNVPYVIRDILCFKTPIY